MKEYPLIKKWLKYEIIQSGSIDADIIEKALEHGIEIETKKLFEKYEKIAEQDGKDYSDLLQENKRLKNRIEVLRLFLEESKQFANTDDCNGEAGIIASKALQIDNQLAGD